MRSGQKNASDEEIRRSRPDLAGERSERPDSNLRLTAGQSDDSSDLAVATLSALLDAVWAVAGFGQLAGSAALTTGGLWPTSPEDHAAARTLVAAGLAAEVGPGYALAPGLAELLSAGSLGRWREATMVSRRQLATVAGIAAGEAGEGWDAYDDGTILAQGRASGMVGSELAAAAVPTLDGLGERFASGGDFLDVGVGVGELAAAFCEAVPSARVVGIDVLPRAVDLARGTIDERGLAGRVELRLQAVQDLADVECFDLAWIPAPFIAERIFRAGLVRVRDALRPGGWLVLGAGHLHGDPLAGAVTRWQTLRAAGTALTEDDAYVELGAAGLVECTTLPTPPWAPALYAARRPPMLRTV